MRDFCQNPGAKAAASHGSTALHVDRRELATILASLRYHADENLQGAEEIPDRSARDIATDGGTLKPLGFDEVCALCERLNFEATAGPGLVISPPPKEAKGQRLYRVVYAIDVNAASATRAARQTRQILVDPDSQPPVMDVIDHRGRIKRIDLSNQPQPKWKGRPR